MQFHRAGAVAPWLVAAIGLSIVGTGCRSKAEEERREMAEARQEYRETRREAEEDLAEELAEADRRIAAADAKVAEEEQEARAAEVWSNDAQRWDARLERLDARLVDLQGRINQLSDDVADRGDHESTWERLDERRATLRRDHKGLGAYQGSELEVRRRDIDAQLSTLEEDIERAIEEVEAQLSRG